MTATARGSRAVKERLAPQSLSSRDLEDALQVSGAISECSGLPWPQALAELGEPILRLLRADFIGTTRIDRDPCHGREEVVAASCIGREKRMSSDYVAEYQHCDPLRALKPYAVGPVRSHVLMHGEELKRTRYFNEFLRPYRTVHGLDLHIRLRGVEIGDLRLWRGPDAPAFNSRDTTVLSLIEPVMHAVLRMRRTAIVVEPLEQLTPKEQQVAERVAIGATDAQIAAELRLSIWTVRSHLTHTFRKLGVANRTALAALLTQRAAADADDLAGMPSSAASASL